VSERCTSQEYFVPWVERDLGAEIRERDLQSKGVDKGREREAAAPTLAWEGSQDIGEGLIMGGQKSAVAQLPGRVRNW